MLFLCSNVILYIAKDCPVTSPVNVNPNASCIRIVMRINNISITYHNVC